MYKKTMLIISFFTWLVLCYSQNPQVESFFSIKKPINSGEQVLFATDRDFYCINEKIFFLVNCQFSIQLKTNLWSNVLYIELISWNGEKIAQAKYKLTGNNASGYLTIPGHVLSGNYYLRAYTKWMRNFPAEEYTYKIIKIVNPFKHSIENGPNSAEIEETNNIMPLKTEALKNIICTTNKNIYKPREKIDLTMALSNIKQIDSTFCISVVKTGCIDTYNCNFQISKKEYPDKDTLTYLPEIRGISISGKVMNMNIKTPIPNTLINLSIPQYSKFYSTYTTSNNGFFYFTLPEFFGNFDFYIDAIIDEEETVNIMIDNDFCNRKINLAYIPFLLDENEKKVAFEMAVNMQLNNIYRYSSIDYVKDTVPFYSIPKVTYYTKEYIKLPNLEEFFFEIVKEVRVVRRNKKTFLKLSVTNSFRDLDPLILIDNIPMLNDNDFLNIPLHKIERVEIIDEPYIVSNSRYNGVISIYTKNKDFAGVKLNKNSAFFSYSLFSNGSFEAPDYCINDTSRIADRRNLLLWDSNIVLKPNQSRNLTFFASDSNGEYTVYIRNISSNNNSCIYGTCKFKVE